MTTELNIAYSPCPNDTFVFHAWAHGLLEDAPQLNVTFADIDITNGLAADGAGPEVLKISYAALPWVLERYRLLPCGGALGRGCGPLVLTRNDGSRSGSDEGQESPVLSGQAGTYTSLSDQNSGNIVRPEDLAGRTIAVPSDRSTAYLLFRLWAAKHIPGGPGNIIVMPFDRIMPALRDGEIDAGLVIHEARFTYPSYGLNMLTDLGSWWESDTGLPIPLGAIIARRDLDHEAISGWIRRSLQHAWDHPADSEDYVLGHAQELSPEVAQSHIGLYVNEFTMNLGADGYAAIEALLNRAAGEGLVPPITKEQLR